jgi:NAD(P)-dependent dehydrogenase (short-subunit alcohol dehydrogenase family)
LSRKHVVITGSTRGIGNGLAKEFLALGCNVTINGRTSETVEAAAAQLGEGYNERRVVGVAGSVADPEDASRIWHEAVKAFGRVDIWINNAGLGQTWALLGAVEHSEITQIIDVNILGTINGCRVAMAGMATQGGGQIYNMEGYGSDGRMGQLLTVYGMSKRAIQYLSRSLAKELSGSTVQLGTLYPGMVVTDLLLNPMAHVPEEFEKAKKIFNIIADRVETVAPYLARRVLSNTKHDVRISWISTAKILLRFLVAPFRKRDLFT